MILASSIAATILIVSGTFLSWRDRIRDRGFGWLLFAAGVLLLPSVVALSRAYLGGGWGPENAVLPIIVVCGLAIEVACIAAIYKGVRLVRSIRDDVGARDAAKALTAITGCSGLTLLVASLFIWVGAILVSPLLDGPVPDQRSANALAALQTRVESTFGLDQSRVLLRRGDNVRVYLSRKAFERVPYPDRHATLTQVSSSWCTGSSSFLLPSVYFFDIQSGEALDSCLCLGSQP